MAALKQTAGYLHTSKTVQGDTYHATKPFSESLSEGWIKKYGGKKNG